MALITYEAEKQRHRDTKIDPNIQTFPELIPALEKDIELFRKSRYIEVNKLIEEQIDILNNYYSSSAEKSEAQDKINYYEQLKTPLLETDPDAIIKKMNESVEEVFVSDDEFQTARSYMPPNISPKVDRKSTRLNSSHVRISYAVFCLKKKIHHKDSNIDL